MSIIKKKGIWYLTPDEVKELVEGKRIQNSTFSDFINRKKVDTFKVNKKEFQVVSEPHAYLYRDKTKGNVLCFWNVHKISKI